MIAKKTANQKKQFAWYSTTTKLNTCYMTVEQKITFLYFRFQVECASVRTFNSSYRCEFVKSAIDCQYSSGFVQYNTFIYCSFGDHSYGALAALVSFVFDISAYWVNQVLFKIRSCWHVTGCMFLWNVQNVTLELFLKMLSLFLTMAWHRYMWTC